MIPPLPCPSACNLCDRRPCAEPAGEGHPHVCAECKPDMVPVVISSSMDAEYAVDYHADPCPEPSLSASGIKRLLYESPASFAAHHPRLTQWPELLDETSDSMDKGSIVHRMILGKGANFVVIDPTQFRNKDGSQAKSFKNADAARAKEKAEEAGNIVVSPKVGTQLLNAAESVIRMLQAEYGTWPIGESERVFTWQRETSQGPIWCRAMMDHFSIDSGHGALILDPKSTSKGLSDRAIASTAAYDGWHIQAAWYIDAAEREYPDMAGRFRFRFPVFELEPPYDCCFFDMPESWLHIARQENERACELFAHHLRAGEWPGRAKVASPEPPAWLESRFLEESLT